MSTLLNMIGGGASGSGGSSVAMISFSISGLPNAEQVVLIPIPDGIILTIPVNMEGSKGRCNVVPTAQADFDVQKNGVSAGTISFALGENTATFIAASEISLNGSNSDYLKIVCPATQDTTLSDIGVAFKVTRS